MNKYDLAEQAGNFVFIGEAGSGKSEIAINMALGLAAAGDKTVHFFDLDMTKPLFRSRDVKQELEQAGVIVHFEEQFMDAPTTTGWVNRLLNDDGCYTVLDVGGDYIGARSIGGYAPAINHDRTTVFYVVNPYRPWSMDIEHIDLVLGEVLGVSHINLEKVEIIGNPNLGTGTTTDEIITGTELLSETIEKHKPIAGICVRKEDEPLLRNKINQRLWSIQLHLSYPF